MTKNNMKKRCSQCDDESNGWCSLLNTNNIANKIANCPNLKCNLDLTDEERDAILLLEQRFEVKLRRL